MLSPTTRIQLEDCEAAPAPRRAPVRSTGLAGKSASGSWPPMPGKYGHGLALAPRAEALAEAFLRLDGPGALRLLQAQHTMGRSLDEIEASTLEPALTKIGELWLRGRVDDAWFDVFGDLALSVERQFRRAIAFPRDRAATVS